MAVTPRTRPPLLDQRLPPRRPELQQRINVPPPAAPPVAAAAAGFPFWMLPAALLLASCIFVTTHFLDHNANPSDNYHPTPWGPNPEGRMGDGFVMGLPSMAPTPEVGVHNLPKYGEDAEGETRMIDLDINKLYGEDPSDFMDPVEREYMNEHCVLHGDVPETPTQCNPVAKLVNNLDFPNVAVEYISKSYNSDEDSTTFTYNVCSLDEVDSISHVTFPYLGSCCVMRTHYFGSTAVGGVDSMTCTFGLSMDTGFGTLPSDDRRACKIYTLTYMGNVPVTPDDQKNMVAIGLGRDKYLQQRVVGPDCRAPFDLDIPPEKLEDFGGFGDGTDPMGTAREIDGEIAGEGDGGADGPVDSGFDFENMFGSEEVAPEEPAVEEPVVPEPVVEETKSIVPEEPIVADTPPPVVPHEPTTTGREFTPDQVAAPPAEKPHNFEATKAFPFQAPVSSQDEHKHTVPGTTGWVVQGRGQGAGGGGNGHYQGDGHGHGGGGHYHGNGHDHTTGRGGPGGPPSQFDYGTSATTGYTTAVNVQSQSYAMTKTAMYSEATEDCTPLADIGYRSKSGQEEALKEIYYSNPYKCGGVVVEINVGNGHKFSSSYYFEYAMGWKSILIEPNPNTFQKLELNRPSANTWNAAFCSNDEKSLTFVEGNGDQGSGKFYSSKGIEDVASVPVAQGQAPNDGTPVRCIDDLSHEITDKTGHKHVDIMYVSNRGGGERGTGDAYAALSSLNFETLSLSILVLEVDSANSFYYSSIATLLKSKGYVKAEWDIRRWCPPVFGSCAQNEVWLEKAFNPLPMVGDPAGKEEEPGHVAIDSGVARRRLQEVFDSAPRLTQDLLYGQASLQEQDRQEPSARHLRRTNHRRT